MVLVKRHSLGHCFSSNLAGKPQRVSQALQLKYLGFHLHISVQTLVCGHPVSTFVLNSFRETCLRHTFCNCCVRYTQIHLKGLFTSVNRMQGSYHLEQAQRSPRGSQSPLAGSQLANLVGCERQRLPCLLSVEEIAFGIVT